MRETDIPLVRELPLFRDMSEEHFETLMRGGYVQNFPPHVELISEGDPSDFLHIVTEGSVELFAGWNDRETTMATVEPHSTFILAASIKDAPYLMSARTLEKSRLVMLPSMDVRTAFEKDNAFARAIVTELAQCYRSVVKNTKGLKLRSSIERLANYLLRQQKKTGGDKSFDLTIEKRRLASYLGMTPENLSRAIKSLQPYGVSIDGIRVTVSDPDDLATLAKPSMWIDGHDADTKTF
ncbi:MAG: helix-turn-helix domain-containing protein [Parvibaculum sp.]